VRLRTTNFPEMPSRMNELWGWVVALDSWDYCEPQPLAELLLKEQNIPPEFLQAVADIISGKRVQKKKAASKQKIPARHRMEFARALSLVHGLVDSLKFDAIYLEGKGVVGIGAAKKREPNEIIRQLDRQKRETVEAACKEFNVSQETVENLLRALKEKIANWVV